MRCLSPLSPVFLAIIASQEPIDAHQAAEQAHAERHEEFGRASYLFCHDPDFGKQGTMGADFCAIFDEASFEVCPAPRQSCPWVAPKHTGTTWKRIVRPRGATISLPKLPQELGLLILGIACACIVGWILRTILAQRWASDHHGDPEEDIEPSGPEPGKLPNRRPRHLLRLAEEASQRGDRVEAVTFLHLAVLRYLDDTGLARFHPSKTNGDYLRGVRPHRSVFNVLRGVARQSERLRFGDGQVDANDLGTSLHQTKALLEAADERVTATAGARTLVLAFGLLAWTSATSGCGEPGPDPAYDSHAPTGMAAFPRLLRAAGIDVTVHRGSVADMPQDTQVVVLRTSGTDPKKMAKSLRFDPFLEDELSLVVIDDHWQSELFLSTTSTVPQRTQSTKSSDKATKVENGGDPTASTKTKAAQRLKVVIDEQVQCSQNLRTLTSTAYPHQDLRLPQGRLIGWDQTIRTSTTSTYRYHLAPLLIDHNPPKKHAPPSRTDGRGNRVHPPSLDPQAPSASGTNETPKDPLYAMAYAVDPLDDDNQLHGCLYVFSDRDLFTNASLVRPENAAFLAAFFAALAPSRKVVIFDRYQGWEEELIPDKPDPSNTLVASNLLPLLAQGMVTLVLFYMLVGAAFGPLRDPVQKNHKAFVAHVEAIGRQYARTGEAGVGHAAQSLARLVMSRNRGLTPGGPEKGWEELAKNLAKKNHLGEKEVRAALRLGIEGHEIPTDRLLRVLSRLLGRTHKKRNSKKGK